MFNRMAALECHATGGRIYCTVRNTELDVDHCFSCPRLLNVAEGKDGKLVVRCAKDVGEGPGCGWDGR